MSVAGQLIGIPAEKYSGTNGVTVDQNNKTIGLDETVLFENASGTQSITLSEAASNFEYLRIEWCPYTEANNWYSPYDVVLTKAHSNSIHLSGWGISGDANYQANTNLILSCASNTLTITALSTVIVHSTAYVDRNLNNWKIYKIVGINRIGGNA